MADKNNIQQPPADGTSGAAPQGGQTAKLAAIAGIAVALAAGLYFARAIWTAEKSGPVTNMPAPVSTEGLPKVADQAAGKRLPEKPADAPVLGVGTAVTASIPGTGTIAIKDGRAVFGLRFPKADPSGTQYTAYQLDVTAGASRYWGVMLAPEEADADGVIAISLNADEIRKQGADLSALVLNVSAGVPDNTTKRRPKFEKIGIVRVALQPAG